MLETACNTPLRNVYTACSDTLFLPSDTLFLFDENRP